MDRVATSARLIYNLELDSAWPINWERSYTRTQLRLPTLSPHPMRIASIGSQLPSCDCRCRPSQCYGHSVIRMCLCCCRSLLGTDFCCIPVTYFRALHFQPSHFTNRILRISIAESRYKPTSGLQFCTSLIHTGCLGPLSLPLCGISRYKRALPNTKKNSQSCWGCAPSPNSVASSANEGDQAFQHA